MIHKLRNTAGDEESTNAECMPTNLPFVRINNIK